MTAAWRLLWAAGSLAAAAAAASSTAHRASACHHTRLGRPCVAFGTNDFGIDPESTACHTLLDTGTPFPLCYVSESRDEVGVCAEGCGPWSAPQVRLPQGLGSGGPLHQLDSAVELIRHGQLEEAEAALTADIKRLLVLGKSKHQGSSDGGGDAEQDEPWKPEQEQSDLTDVHGLVAAAHSLKLLGQINHDQGSLSRAQLHFEMACKLLDQLYGAPFELPSAQDSDVDDTNYSKECYAELLEVLYGQQLHRKALTVESYVHNDEELFPPSQFDEQQDEESEEEAEAGQGREEGKDEDEKGDEDEDEDENDVDETMAMLKSIIHSFVRATAGVRRKLIKATAEELSAFMPAVHEEDVGHSRTGAAIRFVQDIMNECVAGGKKARAQNQHCRRHVNTEVASLLASIEYSKQKVEEAYFVLELRGQGAMCLPQQQMLRSKTYELSMLVELALRFQNELEELMEDEESEGVGASAGKQGATRKSGNSIADIEPTPWSWLEALACAFLIGLVGLPAIKRSVGLQLGGDKKVQGPSRKASRASNMRGQAMRYLGGKQRQQQPPLPCEEQKQSQIVVVEDAEDAEDAPLPVANMGISTVQLQPQSRRVSKKEIRRQRKAKRAATSTEQGKSEDSGTHSSHLQELAHVHMEKTTSEFIGELVEVPDAASSNHKQRQTCARQATTDESGDTDMNSIEPLSLWESDRNSSLRRKQPLPKSPVWSVRSSDSDGADSVGSGGYEDHEDLHDVEETKQREESARYKKKQKAERQVMVGDEPRANTPGTSKPNGKGSSESRPQVSGDCEGKQMDPEREHGATEAAATQIAKNTGTGRGHANSTSAASPSSLSPPGCTDGGEQNLDRRRCDRRPSSSSCCSSSGVASASTAAASTAPAPASHRQQSARAAGDEGSRAQAQRQMQLNSSGGVAGRATTAAITHGVDHSSADNNRRHQQGPRFAAGAQPNPQTHVANQPQPRKRMLTAAEVRARDKQQQRQGGTAAAPRRGSSQASKLHQTQAQKKALSASAKQATAEALTQRVATNARTDTHYRELAAALVVPTQNYTHNVSTTTLNGAVELVDDGTGTMLVTSPWTAHAAEPLPLAGRVDVPAHPFCATRTLTAVQQQVEYYFSDANLAQDQWLRSRMDAEGWIDLALLATFNRVRALTTSMEEIYHALSMSQQLELAVVSWSPPVAKVRRSPQASRLADDTN